MKMEKSNMHKKNTFEKVEDLFIQKIEKIIPITLMGNTVLFIILMNYIVLLVFIPLILYEIYLLFFKKKDKSYKLVLKLWFFGFFIFIPAIIYFVAICKGNGLCAIFEISILLITYIMPLAIIIIIFLVQLFFNSKNKKKTTKK